MDFFDVLADNLTVIYVDFLAEGVHQKFGSPFFANRNKILILGKAPKFGVIFSKICIKINKNLKNY